MRWFGQHRIHMELDGVQRNVMRIRAIASEPCSRWAGCRSAC